MIKKFFEVFVIFLLLSMPLTLAQEDDSQKQGFFSKIASAFGVPYSYLDSSDAKKATSEIAERTYAKTTILPKITRIAEKLNEQLVPLYDDTGRMFLAYDNPVPQDKKALLAENVAYVNTGIMTVNEARLKIGLPKLGEEFDIPKVDGNIGQTSDIIDDGVNEQNEEE